MLLWVTHRPQTSSSLALLTGSSAARTKACPGRDLGEGVRGRNILSLAADPADGQRLYAGLNIGLFVTADGGSTWNAVQGPGSGILSVATSPVDGNRVYAGTFGRGIFVSRDRGESWSAGGNEIGAEMIFAIAAAPVDAETVYAGSASGLFRSNDGGNSWEAVGVELAGHSVRAIQLSAVDPNLMIVGTFGGGLFRSRDGGQSWSTSNDGLGDLGIRSLAVDEASVRQLNDQDDVPRTGEPQVMYVATSTGGFYRTKDGGVSWLAINDGLPGLAARAVLINPADANRILGGGIADGVWEIDFDPEPQIELAGVPVDFGEVDVGVLSVHGLTILNSGSAELIVSGMDLPASEFAVAPDPPFAVAPQAETRVEVRFLPQRNGLVEASLTLRSNDPDEREITVAVRGTGIQPRLVVEPEQVLFNDVRLGEFADTTVVVTNAGTADITIRNAFFDNSTFRLLEFEPRLLRRGERMFLPVRFAPEQALGHTGRLILLTDALTQPRFEINVDGEGVAPVISLSERSVDFGTVVIKGTRPFEVQVSNGGNVDLVIERIELLSAPFAIQSEGAATVAPGSTFSIDLTFAPLTSGVAEDTLRVFSNALAPFDVVELPLHGVGGALALTANPPVSINPGAARMIIADLDRDGSRDIVLADSVLGVLQVLLNDGQALVPETNKSVYPGLLSAFEPWDEPVAVAAATIFDIGPDLIVADRVAQSVSIIRNNGLGGFNDRREDIFIGHDIAELQAMDLDADGDVDIAVASAESPSLTMLFNNGLGTFNARTTELIGGMPTAMKSANLNSDGRADLVVATESRDGVSVLLSNGLGGFERRSDFNVGLLPVDVEIVDYDADGDNDIVTANRGSLDFSLLANDGFGSFPVEPIQVSTGTQTENRLQPQALALSDLSADEFSDLVAVGPESPHIVFLENDAGLGFSPKDLLTSSTPARSVEIVDMNGDGVNDLVVFSSSASQVQVFINENTRRQDPPRPPTKVSARDVPRDLGRQIEISWHAPELNEQIGRTTTYTIYRSTTADGTFESIGEALAGFRTFVDTRAPLGETFYYKVVAGNASSMSELSAATSAASRPAPFFELELLNEPRFSVGDTLRVKTFVTPADHAVSGLSLYITFDDSVLTLIDAIDDPESVAPVSPFRLDGELRTDGLTWLPEDQAVVENRLHQGSTNRIDISLVGLVLPPGNDPIPLGEIWFLTGTDAVTDITIDDEFQFNRSSGVIDGETGAWILPFISPRPTQVTIRDFPVTGQVELEGRDRDRDVSMDLVFIDEEGGQLASPLNDENRLRPGIQVTLDADGGFQLAQIPAGTYRVFAKSPSYLRGRVVLGENALTGVPVGQTSEEVGGLSRPHLNFEWVDADSLVVPVLPAGDGNDDNRVNLADFGLLVRYFGVNQDNRADWTIAQTLDFDASDMIDLADFFLLAQNFGEVGLEPFAVAKQAPAPGWVRPQADPPEHQVLLVGEVGAISGFAIAFAGDQELEYSQEGTIWQGEGMQIHQWQKGDLHWFVGALTEPDRQVYGDGVLARVSDVGEMPVRHVEVLTPEGDVVRPTVRASVQVPSQSALLQNYPNPFNPTTVIPFQVGSEAAFVGIDSELPDGGGRWVELEIFNPLGQKLRTLVGAAMPAGSHHLEWDGRDDSGTAVASGIYIYRLRIGRFVQSRRLLLMR